MSENRTRKPIYRPIAYLSAMLLVALLIAAGPLSTAQAYSDNFSQVVAQNPLEIRGIVQFVAPMFLIVSGRPYMLTVTTVFKGQIAVGNVVKLQLNADHTVHEVAPVTRLSETETETPEGTELSRATRTPGATEPAHETDHPRETEHPHITNTPRPTNPPSVTRTPHPTEPPHETEHPTEPPQSTDTHGGHGGSGRGGGGNDGSGHH